MKHALQATQSSTRSSVWQ